LLLSIHITGILQYQYFLHTIYLPLAPDQCNNLQCTDSVIDSIAFSLDGKILAAGNRDTTVTLFP